MLFRSDRSLIADSLKNIYKPLIASGYTAPCPTLGDLYRDLNKSNLRRAKQLALMLDVFANGSLQAFSHTTNVDMNNRLICFNIQSLGILRPANLVGTADVNGRNILFRSFVIAEFALLPILSVSALPLVGMAVIYGHGNPCLVACLDRKSVV